MERATVPFTIYNDRAADDWKRDVIALLERVIAADQRIEANNTMQDTKHDGPIASQARALIARAG